MKKFIQILVLLAAALWGLPAAAQSICFWTDDADAVPVRIYIDEEYIGDVTAAFSEQPLLDTPGCLSVDTTPDRHSLTAVDKYGRVYKGWPGSIRPRTDAVNYLQIRAGGFRVVDQRQYDYVFTDWVPLYYFMDAPVRYGRYIPVDELDPLTDNGLLIGMGVAAVGATAALGVAAARNWNFPDSRYPFVALGFNTEYFSSLRAWRNVAQFKARFGNLGGVSLMADAGVAIVPDRWSYDGTSTWRDVFPDRWRANTSFTWSVGAGLDYGGFGFSIRYKPAFGPTEETFLTARFQYDWWVSKGFALDFHAGFGVGGFGEGGTFDHYDFPVGMGFLIRL